MEYDVLARSRIVRDFETAFRKATGIWVKLAPTGPPKEVMCRRGEANPFCTLVTDTASGHAACLKAEASLQQRVSAKFGPYQCRCFSGLSMVAIPVLIGGQHIATLLAGQVFRRKPTRQDMARLEQNWANWGSNGQLPALKQAYRRTPVLTEEQFHANLTLLAMFARSLAEYVRHGLIAKGQDEAPQVRAAKEFAQQHAHERMTMRDAARHVHLSPFYFCKIFKKATGTTYSEYVTRLRVDKARTLLLNPFMRVTDVAYKAGFHSIPYFNGVFKKYVGQSPTAYRKALGNQFTI